MIAQALLALGPLSAALAVAAAAWAATRRGPGSERAARTALLGVVGVHAILLLWLALAFLRMDLSLHVVWATSHRDLAWWYRLAGVWGAQPGTYLLWSALAAACVLVEDARRAGEPAPTWRRARLVALGTVAALSLAPLLLGLGRATADYHLAPGGVFRYDPGGTSSTPLDVWPDGFGLDRLLVTPFMLVHPPLEFTAYALTTIPFAYGIAHLARGGAWIEAAMPWARRAWLVFTAAIALGGLWAYYVLSFGGFWAWDPVETADLLPWIALTVLLHAAHVAKKGDGFGVIGPVAATLPFLVVLAATFVTRGGLWVSIHAFLPVPSVFVQPDAGRRWVLAAATSPAARFATGTLVAAALGTAGAVAARAARTPSAPRAWRVLAAALAATGALALLLPVDAARVLAIVGRVLGAGSPLLGALVLLALLVCIAALPMLLQRGPRLSLDPRFKPGQLALATLLLGLALLTTMLLLVLGVNGAERAVYDSRLPFLALPLLLFSAVAYGPVKAIRARLLVPIVAALAGGAVLAVRPGWASVPWAALPLALVGVAGAVRLIAERAEPGNPIRARVRAGLLSVAGLLGLLHWTSPPAALALPGVALAVSPPIVLVGLLASVGALLGVFLEGRRGWPRALTVLCGIAAWGHAVGAVATLAAAALGRGPVLVDTKPGAKKLGVPLIHGAVALLVLGVAFAFYAPASTAFTQAQPLERGVPAHVAGFTLTLLDGRGTDADGDGRHERIQAVVEIRRGDRAVGERHLTMVWDVRGSVTDTGGYLPWDAAIHRTPLGDLYLNGDLANPLALRLAGSDGNATWVVSGGSTPPVADAQVEAAALTVLWIPGVPLVWGGIAALLLGMSVRLAAPPLAWRAWTRGT